MKFDPLVRCPGCDEALVERGEVCFGCRKSQQARRKRDRSERPQRAGVDVERAMRQLRSQRG